MYAVQDLSVGPDKPNHMASDADRVGRATQARVKSPDHCLYPVQRAFLELVAFDEMFRSLEYARMGFLDGVGPR